MLEGLFVTRPKSVKVGSRLGFSNWEWFATFKASISANGWFAAMLPWLVTVAFTMASSTLSLLRGARQVYFAFQSITFYLCEISVRDRHRPWCWFCPKGSISERPASGTSRIESGESVGQAGGAQAACLPDSEVLLEIVIRPSRLRLVSRLAVSRLRNDCQLHQSTLGMWLCIFCY